MGKPSKLSYADRCSSATRKTFILAIGTLAISYCAYASATDAAARCKAISQMKLDGVAITAASSVESGIFTPSGATSAMVDLPPFCRIAAILQPTPESNIKIELWMPEKDWNGRFLGTGNGGGAGKLSYRSLAFGMRRGFATANTDMGTSPNADAVVGHPQRWADFGYRSTHQMTVVSKQIIRAYYDKPEGHAYFVGCSTGGGQGLMEAQRYPGDYNGIIAGAPANNRTHIHTGFVWNAQAANQPPGVQLAPETIAFITKSALNACAGKDGGAPDDRFLTDPRECKFAPDTLSKCQGNSHADCLFAAELSTLKKFYAGPTNPRTGERIYTPIPVGSENSPDGVATQQDPKKMSGQWYPFRWAMGSSFDYHKFDFDHDQDRVDKQLAPILNANNPDLSALQQRGGKILMFTGTADPLVPFQDALNYYDRVVQDQQKRLPDAGGMGPHQGLTMTRQFFRYFLVPGMAHCGGGPGLHDFGQSLQLEVPQDSDHDILTALVRWVEEGVAPEKIIASTYVDDLSAKGIRFQRPICPYPQFPKYISGDQNSASSYRCIAHPQDSVLVPASRYLN
ncbi:MAG: tannase/feruloyl esterase family alpha/beta hydrolase [Acidobacteriaceae bacterium]